MVVLEELDSKKKGLSEVAHNARQASRFIDELTHDKTHDEIMLGLSLRPPSLSDSTLKPGGRLFFQTRAMATNLPDTLPVSKADNTILATALALQEECPDINITLVSKDINLRIKAAIVGLHAEDYFNDQVLDDIDLLYTGIYELPDDFWESHNQEMESWIEKGKTFYKVCGPLVKHWFPNQFLRGNHNFPLQAVVRVVNSEDGYAIFEMVNDYMHPKHTVWGVNARNFEQNYALNLLMDPNIDFVSLAGPAGTGKTLLTLAAGLAQTLEDNTYREIIMTRATIPVGEDIGFLPGTEEEKMMPWMGALLDNLEVLTKSEGAGDWGRAATNDVIRSRIKIRSLNFLRGRTFLNRFIILDEAQNLTSKQMKTLITRAGPESKVIALGNIAQIDTPYLTETTSGLTYVVDRFRSWSHSGSVMLTRGERSRLADYANDHL
jgi:PhoH-like ATPase